MHRPWLDTIWRGGLTLTGNEFDEPLLPDNLAATVEWKQLLGPLQVEARNRTAWYFDDKHRDSSSPLRTSFTLAATYERWLRTLERQEIQAGLTWDAASGDLAAHLAFTWHFGAGRGYRDFSPSDVDFLDLRQRRLPSAANNGMTYEPAN